MRKRSAERIHVPPLLAGLAASSAALTYAVIALRMLAEDSAPRLVTFLMQKRPHYDPRIGRQFDAIVQLPALALTYLAGSQDWTQAIIWTWGLGYNLHPFLSLALCWAICRRNRAENIFVFPVLSFATATMMTLGHPHTDVPTTLSAFWPLFLWVRLERPSPLWYAGILAGSACLAFSHQTACILFAVLFLSVGRLNAVSCLFGAGSLWLLWGAIQGYALSYGFRFALRSPWGPFTWGLIAAAGGVGASLWWARRTRKSSEGLLWGCGILALFVFLVVAWLQPDQLASIDTSKTSRTAAIPVAGFVALLALWFADARGPFWRPLSHFVAALLFLGALYDVAITESWSKGARAMKAALSAPGGSCALIEGAEFHRDFAPAGVPDAYFPHVSLLFQGVKRPRRILGVRSYTEGMKHLDFCRFVSDGWMASSINWRLDSSGYLDFSGLYGPERVR